MRTLRQQRLLHTTIVIRKALRDFTTKDHPSLVISSQAHVVMASRKKKNVLRCSKPESNIRGSGDPLHNIDKLPMTKATTASPQNAKLHSRKASPVSPIAVDIETPARASSVVTEAKKKAHKYKLNYEESPFPNYPLPTAETAEEVHRLLTKEHGECKPPTKVPAPSATRSGCGEVPDLLDALIRTVLSANTTSKNSSEALKGLINTFGIVDGSPDWQAVSRANAEEIAKAIVKGGLSVIKGKNIKSILTIVRAQNIERRNALLKEKATGESAHVPATSHLTQEQKDAEIARIEENPLTMAWIFEIQKDSDIIDELIKLPGIGVKTASCCLLFNLQRPSFAVDTHVHRHCKWLGWVPQSATADQTFNHCDLRLPDHLKYGLHTLFIRHGKTCYRCRAITNSSSAEWETSKPCPIEHLVDRSITKKPHQKRKLKEEDRFEDVTESVDLKMAKREVSSKSSSSRAVKMTKSMTGQAAFVEPRPSTVIPTRPKRAANKQPIKYESASSDSQSDEVVSEYGDATS